MSRLKETASICADYLRTIRHDTRTDASFTEDDRFRNWLKEAYQDSEFLYRGDIIAGFEALDGKPEADMSLCETRCLITYHLRAMRCCYGEYEFIKDGTLLRLLERWLKLTEEES